MFILAVAVSTVSAGVWLFIIRCYDRLQPEPIKTMLWVGLAGGFLATLVAGLLNGIVSVSLGFNQDDGGPLGQLFTMAVFVGLNEEAWKAFFTFLLLSRRKEVDEPIDGMIYAMTASLGFAAFENIHYMLEHGLGVIVVRSLLSVPAHLACGAIWGYGYSKVRFVDRKKRADAPCAALGALGRCLPCGL
jgi:RsiW-degrading membrane proteinase PrsW (M82 family)